MLYPEGSYFGDSDILLKIEGTHSGRDSTAISETICQLLVLWAKDLFDVLVDFPAIEEEMKAIAKER